MARYGDLKDDNPKLTSFDLCRDYEHQSPPRYSHRDMPHDGTKAVTIVAETNYEGTKLTGPATILCRKHASPEKAAVTKRGRGAYRIIIENADVSSRERVDAQAAAALALRIVEDRATAKARAERISADRPQHLVDRLVERPASIRVDTKTGVDETYKTGVVRVQYQSLTPGQARYLAKSLLEAADKAEAIR